MARSLLSVAMQMARAAERANRAQAREHARRQREHLRALRDDEREQQRAQLAHVRNAREMAREEKRAYVEERVAEVEEKNTAIDEKIAELGEILTDSLARSHAINWTKLQQRVDEADLNNDERFRLGPPPKASDYKPKPPGAFTRLLPGWKTRHEKRVNDLKSRYQAAVANYDAKLSARQVHFAKIAADAQQSNQNIQTFREAYKQGNPEAVGGYFDLVFEQSEYPEGFPQKWRTAYLPQSRQLIVDFDLPSLDEAIPTVERYRYNKSNDAITETPKAPKTRQAFYSALVAQMVLRRLHEVYSADKEKLVSVAAVNAFVDAVDPSTGQRVRPCLVSVRTSREEFRALDLRQVDPLACLRRLNAAVSRSPSELVAVKPVIDINMSDPRFIQEADILSTLDNRPNLMELTPGEFENLITNLFQRMGLETKLTQASRDGGVDCVAFDPRPVLGGKVVIQAKRYKNTVGVSAVRDLYGTMHNEGASKGILVTTSGYGRAAFDFQNGKPLELLDGSNLLYLLKEHAGIEAKIVVPDNWRDPLADA